MAGVSDVDEHVARLGEFKRYFPEYASCRLYGALAAVVMPEETAWYAYRQELWVLAQSGDQIVILNDERFRSRAW